MATIMTKRGQLDNVVTYEHICDTVADMANINPSYITLGSVCIVIKGENDDLEVYIADSRKEWKIVSSSSGESGSISSSGIHICAQDEYDSVTGIPTIQDPLSNTFYLTPGSNETNDLYNEWIWLEDDEEWEKFGSATTAISQPDWNQSDSSANDFIKNKPSIRQQANGGGILENGATSASGANSHAEGYGTTASGALSHAEGNTTVASNEAAHAEGRNTTASGRASHAEGGYTTASGENSHAEGADGTASGPNSHSEGIAAVALGIAAHAEGQGTIANAGYQHVAGQYNVAEDATRQSGRGTYVEIVGNGTDTTSRSNARTLDWNGNAEFKGDVVARGCGAANPVSLIGVNTSIGDLSGLDTTDKTSIVGAINEVAGGSGMNIVTVSGTAPTITAQSNTQYLCGEVVSLDFTPAATGISDVIFTSGSTVAVLTLPATVKMPDWFEVEANHMYEISILNGLYGVVASWQN